jgi:hypothetical protein
LRANFDFEIEDAVIAIDDLLLGARDLEFPRRGATWPSYPNGTK